MKHANKFLFTVVCLLLVIMVENIFAQSNEDVLNFLVQKKLITQQEADSLRAEDAVKQQEKPKDKTFTVSIDFKPRGEYRNGYRYLREDTTTANFQVLGRSRINITYEHANKLKFHTSIQDVRTWGQYDPRSTAGTLQIFESYVDAYFTPKFFTRIGRQKIALDNQRLFAENDWRPNAGAHDGVSFHYVNPDKGNFETSVYGAFNQFGFNQFFNTDFRPGSSSQGGVYNPYLSANPSSWSFYKYLGLHYLKYKISDFTLTTINSIDGFEDAKIVNKHYNRYTNGGRIEWENGNFYATFSGYYQWGNNSGGKELKAWYIQPEIKYTNKQFNNNVRLGVEVLSGADGTNTTNTGTDYSFEPLYGVAHRFNGHMDFFTQFPKDLNNAGLVNPYLFLTQNLGEKFSIQAHFHLFYAQNKLVDANKNVMDPYVGFENDFVFQYKPNKYTAIEIGADYANLTSSAAAMKQPSASALSRDPNNKSTGGNPDLIPVFSYLQIRFNPEIFKAKF